MLDNMGPVCFPVAQWHTISAQDKPPLLLPLPFVGAAACCCCCCCWGEGLSSCDPGVVPKRFSLINLKNVLKIEKHTKSNEQMSMLTHSIVLYLHTFRLIFESDKGEVYDVFLSY